MSGLSAPMVGAPDGSFAEAPFAQQQSGILESTEPLQATRQVLRASARATSEFGVVQGPMGEPSLPMEREDKVPPDVLNKQYGIPGRLTFADAVPDTVARSMYETKIEEIKRQDIAQRAPPGFISGAARFGAQFAAGLLDPLQIGAAMVPVAPELSLGASLGARIGARALEGGIGGLVGTAPLVGLQYGLSRQEQSDFTAYDALFELAQGAGFGAGIGALSAGGGAFGRALSERYRRSSAAPVSDADPAVRASSLQTGLSQIEQGNPVEVRPVYDQSNVPEEYGEPVPPPPGVSDRVRDESWVKDTADVSEALAREPLPSGWEIGADPNSIGYNVYDSNDRVVGHSPTPSIVDAFFVARRAADERAVPGRRTRAFLSETEPKGLTQFLREDFTVGSDANAERRAGGLRDEGGDLASIIGGPRGRPGLINNDSGSSLHDAAIRAYEAGYFDHVPEDNELLDAIAKDHNRANASDAIYSSRDQTAAEDSRYAREHNVEVDQFSAQTGIPTEGKTPAQFWDQVADHLSQEEALQHVTRLESEHNEAFEQAEQATKDWVAYHGTPHEFDQFNTAQIGTGEGAQAYGHGLYFAENRGVADSYRNQLSPVADDALSDAKAALRRSGGDLDAAIEDNRTTWKDPTNKYAVQVEGILKYWKTNGISDEVPPSGHLYTVRLRAKPEEMLDWDKPLSEQPAAVREAIDRMPEAVRDTAYVGSGNHDPTGHQIYEALASIHADRRREEPTGWGAVAGGPVYHDAQIRDPAAASKVLRESGVKGIRYLDRSSRAEGEGTRNVVVFDHNDVEITHRNGEAVERKPFDPEEVYRGAPHTLEDMEHEWRQAETAHPIRAGEGGGGQPGSAAEPEGAVQGSSGQGSGAAGVAGRPGSEEQSQIRRSALRDAAGERSPDPTSAAAERAVTEGEQANLVKLAQQDIEDHQAFFDAADRAGQLTEDVRAELEAINGLDQEAADRIAAAKQAAACIARGMT